MTYQLIHADSTAIDLPDDSVDLIVTSPPYFALRSYQDGGEHYDGQIGSEGAHGQLEPLGPHASPRRRFRRRPAYSRYS